MSCILDNNKLTPAFTQYVSSYMTDQQYPTTGNFTPLPSTTFQSYNTAVDSQHALASTLQPVLGDLQSTIDTMATSSSATADHLTRVRKLHDTLNESVNSILQTRTEELSLHQCGDKAPKPKCCPTPQPSTEQIETMDDVIPGIYCDVNGCIAHKPLQTGPWNVDGALGGNVVVYEMNNQCQLTVNGCDTGDDPSKAPCDQFSCQGKQVNLLDACDIELIGNNLGWVPTVTFKDGTCAPATKSPLSVACSPPS